LDSTHNPTTFCLFKKQGYVCFHHDKFYWKFLEILHERRIINLNICKINLILDWREKYENWMVHVFVVKLATKSPIKQHAHIKVDMRTKLFYIGPHQEFYWGVTSIWVLILVSLKRMSSLGTSILENLAIFAWNNSLKGIGVQSKYLGGKEWMRRTSLLSLVWMKKQHGKVNLGMKK
jgi:hypothetical protein